MGLCRQKKDIAWEEMRGWRNQKAKERFYKLEQMFLAGKTDSDFYGEIVPDGVIRWGRYVYRKGSTLEEYLEEYGIPSNWKYPIARMILWMQTSGLAKRTVCLIQNQAAMSR